MSNDSDTADQDAIQRQRKRLASHRERLAILLAQQAHFGAHVPPHILISIREAQKALRPIKAWLRTKGTSVADEPNDDCPLDILYTENDPLDFTTTLRHFMDREHRNARDLQRLTKISDRTIENWRAGVVREPREISDLLKIARALALDCTDATTLLVAAGKPTLDHLWTQAQRADDTMLRNLLTFWAAELEQTMSSMIQSTPAEPESPISPPRAPIADEPNDVMQVAVGATLSHTTEEQDHLSQLRLAHVKRLHFLELIQAKKGSNTPAHILNEIDEVSKKITTIDAQLNGTISTTSTAAMVNSSCAKASPGETMQINIIFKGDFNTLTEEIQQQTIRVLAALIGIEPDQIRIVKVMEGSIIFQIEIPKEAAKRLLDMYQAQDPILEDIDITEVNEVLDPTQPDTTFLNKEKRNRLKQEVAIQDDQQREYSFGAWLQQQRRARRWMQKELAEFLGCALGTLKKIESDERRPGRALAERIATVLGLPEQERALMVAVARGEQSFDRLTLNIPSVSPSALEDEDIDIIEISEVLNPTQPNTIAKLKIPGFDVEQLHIDTARVWETLQAGTPDDDRSLVAMMLATTNIGELRYDIQRDLIPQLERALADARRLGDRLAEARLHISRGRAAFSLGALQQAIRSYEEARAIFQELGDQHGTGRALDNLGLAYARLGKARLAISCYEQARGIFQKLGDLRREGHALGNLGDAYAALDDPQRAGFYLKQALQAAKESGDRSFEGTLLISLGELALAQNDPQAGRACFEHALEIARKIGDRREEGYTLITLGRADTAIGDRTSASRAFAAALAIFEAIEDHWGEAECRWQYGLVLAHQGDQEHALPLLRAAVAYQEAIEHVQAAAHAALLKRLEAGIGSDSEDRAKLGGSTGRAS